MLLPGESNNLAAKRLTTFFIIGLLVVCGRTLTALGLDRINQHLVACSVECDFDRLILRGQAHGGRRSHLSTGDTWQWRRKRSLQGRPRETSAA